MMHLHPLERPGSEMYEPRPPGVSFEIIDQGSGWGSDAHEYPAVLSLAKWIVPNTPEQNARDAAFQAMISIDGSFRTLSGSYG